MKSIVLALLVLASSASFTPLLELWKNDGKNCDSSLTGFKVSLFEVTPCPPKKGEEIHCKMVGQVSKEQDIKDVDVEVKLNGINFYHTTFDKSKECEPHSTCTLKVHVNIPGIAPSGRYSIIIKVKNTKGDDLNCWQYNCNL